MTTRIQDDNTNHDSKFLMGFVAGGTSARASRHFCTAAGSELRQRVTASTTGLRDAASDGLQAAADRVADVVDASQDSGRGDTKGQALRDGGGRCRSRRAKWAVVRKQWSAARARLVRQTAKADLLGAYPARTRWIPQRSGSGMHGSRSTAAHLRSSRMECHTMACAMRKGVRRYEQQNDIRVIDVRNAPTTPAAAQRWGRTIADSGACLYEFRSFAAGTFAESRRSSRRHSQRPERSRFIDPRLWRRSSRRLQLQSIRRQRGVVRLRRPESAIRGWEIACHRCVCCDDRFAIAGTSDPLRAREATVRPGGGP
jgi:hypothetical protein